MRKIILLASSLLLTTGLSLSVWAQDTTASPSDNSSAAAAASSATDQTGTTAAAPMAAHPKGACANIMTACMNAGFTKHGAKGKRIWKDCVQPTLLGQSISGVTADPNDVQACKSKVAAKLRKRADQMSAPNNAGTTGSATPQ